MRPRWTRRLPAAPLEMHWAREAGLILVRDATALSLWDVRGEPVVARPGPGPVIAAGCAEDGSAFVCAEAGGTVRVYREELTPGWERTLSRRPVALAVAPLGQAVAVADDAGGLTVFDGRGQDRWQTTAPRPLRHLAWVAEAGALAGSADFGLVCLYDDAGQQRWRDGLVAHVGALAASGDGARVVLACFTDGVRRYGVEQPRPVTLGEGLECRSLASSYAGDVLLTLSLDGTTLTRRDGMGQAQGSLTLSGPVAGFALDALGETAVVALSSGELLMLG
jgi:hypothetical protein